MDRYYQFSLAVPAETAIAAPVSMLMPTENAWLVDVEIVIPRGHAGLTGIRVLQSSQQILPWGGLSWIIGDGYIRTFQVDNEVGSRALSLSGYNIDVQTHTFEVRVHLRDLADASDGAQDARALAVPALMGLSSLTL